MLFSLFGWELVWIRKFKRISIRNHWSDSIGDQSPAARGFFNSLPRWFDRYFLPTQSFPNTEPEQCPKWWWLFIAEQKCSIKGCSMRTNIFRSSEGDGNVPRADPFFHLIRMKMDSQLRCDRNLSYHEKIWKTHRNSEIISVISGELGMT